MCKEDKTFKTIMDNTNWDDPICVSKANKLLLKLHNTIRSESGSRGYKIPETVTAKLATYLKRNQLI